MDYLVQDAIQRAKGAGALTVIVFQHTYRENKSQRVHKERSVWLLKNRNLQKMKPRL
jgi:hypothetical protein